jgi:hypothetical protein
MDVESVKIPVISKGIVYYYIIDKFDLERSQCYAWSYANGYIYNGKHRMLLHRFLMYVLDKPEVKIDHINGNKLDNRKSNLRICTSQQNNMNQKKSKSNTTGFKGVSLDKKSGKYQTQIQKDRNLMHLGRFSSAEEAARCYDKYAKLHFGEFARLNFPDECSESSISN